MQLTLRPRGIGALLAVLVLAVGGGVAYGSIPASDGTYTACLDSGGKLRLIDAEAGQACKKNETTITWSQAARLACPDGTILSTGVCIETTERAAATHSEAEDACSDEGRRLPSGGELRTFADADGITLTSGHWTDDVADINEFSTFAYFVVTDTGNGIAEALDDMAYRCVAGAGIG